MVGSDVVGVVEGFAVEISDGIYDGIIDVGFKVNLMDGTKVGIEGFTVCGFFVDFVVDNTLGCFEAINDGYMVCVVVGHVVGGTAGLWETTFNNMQLIVMKIFTIIHNSTKMLKFNKPAN